MSATKKEPTSERRAKATADASAPYLVTGAAFDGGESLRRDCTAADLFHLLFDSPNVDCSNILEMVMSCMSDDFELIGAAASTDHCLEDVIVRVAHRNSYRIRVAIEMSRRMKEAQQAEVRP